MAGIDKTYTDSYTDYRKFKDWADGCQLTFFDGLTVCPGDWVWKLEPEDFADGERPIMNTPMWLDIYLIQNCKAGFVLDRMREVYDEEEYLMMQAVDLTAEPSPPEDLQRGRKIRVRPTDHTRFPLHSKPYGKGGRWWLQCLDLDFWYNDETRRWVGSDTPYPYNTNTTTVTSVKALVRHLRKQYLPKGITFRLMGRYVGEEYLVTVS